MVDKSSRSPGSRSTQQTPSDRAGGDVVWDGIHAKGASWRKQLVGEISDAFVLPRYVKLFFDTFGERRAASFLEVGAGNGDNTDAILRADTNGVIATYIPTEVFDEGVAWLRERGFAAQRASAERLPYPDGSFDGVIEFDVMHHVDNPRLMAKEMLRVGRGRLLLTESNGLSIPRKLLELLPARKAAGEKSFTPWKWRSFFYGHDGYEIKNIVLYPFLFPFKCPHWFLSTLVWFNKVIEKVPFFRWQCSSIVIVIDYVRTPSRDGSADETISSTNEQEPSGAGHG